MGATPAGGATEVKVRRGGVFGTCHSAPNGDWPGGGCTGAAAIAGASGSTAGQPGPSPTRFCGGVV
eukprot:6602596-Alexandrium_andersonii.AAC.1